MSGKLRPFGDPDKPSKVEKAKANSRRLRSSIAEVLASDAPAFEHDDIQTMKFHGIYQQDDRDARPALKAVGLDKQYSFMVRVKIPGGALTPRQYLAMDQIADQFTYNASLRVTTRQTFQLHGVVKGELKLAMQQINHTLLSTLCGCGDVERNIMAPPAPINDPAHNAVRQLANKLSEGLVPQTNAYFEIWLDGQKVESSKEDEPLYGETYLPRKFKTGIALPDDNSTDVHSQDVGLIAIVDDDGALLGCNLLVGGGLGMTHKKPETYARLGTELGFVDAQHVVDAARVVASIFRDFGDRTDRKHARLKYIVEEQGIDAFRDEFASRAQFPLKPWVEVGQLTHQDWLGKHPQDEQSFFYGVFIPNGRIIDREKVRLKSALKTIVQSLEPTVILTPNQNVIFGDLSGDDLKKLEKILDAYNVPKVESLSGVRRHSMACPALPTCGVALTESERVFPDVVDALEKLCEELGVDDAPFTVRMTGCPNGCARPYTADVGLVGHKPGHYDLFLGGARHGHRMAEFYAQNVPIENIPDVLRPIFHRWADERMPEEPLGDFYNRTYADNAHRHIATGDRDHPASERVGV